MTSTPYGPPPADMQHKTMRDITPAEAYRLASPAQRRQWFGDDLPTKAAGPYDLPPAAGQVSALTPELEAKLAHYRAVTVGDQREPICPQCRSAYGPGQGTVNGYCRHRSAPGMKAVELQEARRAEATRLYQQARRGMLGNPVRVVDVGRAAQEDAMRAEWHAVIEELFGGL